MLKHLRTGWYYIDNYMHCGLGSQQRSLESQKSMAPGSAWSTGVQSQSAKAAGAIIQAFYFSDPVPLFLVQNHFR